MLHKWRNKLEKTEVQINEEDIGKLPEKEFRIMIVKTIKNLENKMEKLQKSINKHSEELKNKHTATNNTNTEIKNTLEGINIWSRRMNLWAEEKMVEITSEEQNKVKTMKRTEDSLRDLWYNIKPTDIRIIGVPEEEEKKKGYENVFEEIIVENFPNMEKETVSQVQEAQSPIQDKSKEKHAKAHINQTYKD